MYHFEIDCPNEGLGRVMFKLKEEGIQTDSRNGPVIRFPKPVCLVYPDPRRRVLDHPVRDANHFFHLVETMWMFAGLSTVKDLDLFQRAVQAVLGRWDHVRSSVRPSVEASLRF
jgi:hypothetical protein